jgi:hypothetical protein
VLNLLGSETIDEAELERLRSLIAGMEKKP